MKKTAFRHQGLHIVGTAESHTHSDRGAFEAVAGRLDAFNLISIDVFDTLICRRLQHPTDVFRLVAKEGQSVVGPDIADFHTVRVEAEHDVRRSLSRRGVEEITLQQIYRRIADEYELEKQEAEALIALETDLERELCAITDFGRFMIDYRAQTRAAIVFTTDMYLPRAVIEDMLRDLGLDIYDRLFVSNEAGKTKFSGSLYSHVLSEMKADPGDMIHVGDNYEVDIERAEALGIATVHLPAARSVFDNRDLWTKSTLFRNRSLTKNFCNTLFMQSAARDGAFDIDALGRDKDRYLESLGWTVLAPILMELCVWIKKACDSRGIRHLAFLARDGLIVKECFDRMYGRCPIATTYTFASRRMLTLPFVVLSEHEIRNYFARPIGAARTAGEILDVLPGSEPLRNRLAELSVDLEAPLSPERKDTVLRLIGENSGLLPEGLKPEAGLVEDYLRSQFPKDERFATFDLGWRGSLQLAISKIVPDLAGNMHGLYFGTTAEAAFKLLPTDSTYSSFAVSNGRPEDFRHTCQTSTDVIEFLFSADHPSVETVEKTQAGFVPKYFPISIAERQTQEDALTIQRGALAAIDAAVDRTDLSTLEHMTDRKAAIRDFFALLKRPGRADATHLSNARVFSGIGDLEGVPLIGYDPDRSIFRQHLESLWPAAFNQRLNRFQKILLFVAAPKWWVSVLPSALLRRL